MKPHTQLPWHTRGPEKRLGLRLFIEAPKANGMPYALDVCGEDYTGYGEDEAREQNMRYIAHAANAYPRLVEALRAVAPIIERFAAESDPQNSVLDQRRDELRALLRELGEDT